MKRKTSEEQKCCGEALRVFQCVYGVAVVNIVAVVIG